MTTHEQRKLSRNGRRPKPPRRPLLERLVSVRAARPLSNPEFMLERRHRGSLLEGQGLSIMSMWRYALFAICVGFAKVTKAELEKTP